MISRYLMASTLLLASCSVQPVPAQETRPQRLEVAIMQCDVDVLEKDPLFQEYIVNDQSKLSKALETIGSIDNKICKVISISTTDYDPDTIDDEYCKSFHDEMLKSVDSKIDILLTACTFENLL